jgi:hypothetical protein
MGAPTRSFRCVPCVAPTQTFNSQDAQQLYGQVCLRSAPLSSISRQAVPNLGRRGSDPFVIGLWVGKLSGKAARSYLNEMRHRDGWYTVY